MALGFSFEQARRTLQRPLDKWARTGDADGLPSWARLPDGWLRNRSLGELIDNVDHTRAVLFKPGTGNTRSETEAREIIARLTEHFKAPVVAVLVRQPGQKPKAGWAFEADLAKERPDLLNEYRQTPEGKFLMREMKLLAFEAVKEPPLP